MSTGGIDLSLLQKSPENEVDTTLKSLQIDSVIKVCIPRLVPLVGKINKQYELNKDEKKSTKHSNVHPS